MATFKILYFAAATSYSQCDEELLPAPMRVGDLYAELDRRYPGIREKVLDGSMLTVNLEYVDVECDADMVIGEGFELAIIPPVSAG